MPAATLAHLEEIGRRFKATIDARQAAEAARITSEEARAALETELIALQAEIAVIEVGRTTFAHCKLFARCRFAAELVANIDCKAPRTA
jgi:hypothetical protein